MTACKRCGKPANLYSKWLLCDDCGAIKQRWENFEVVSRIFTILIGIQLMVPFLYAIARIDSPLTTYVYVIYMASLFGVGLIATWYTHRKTTFK